MYIPLVINLCSEVSLRTVDDWSEMGGTEAALLSVPCHAKNLQPRWRLIPRVEKIGERKKLAVAQVIEPSRRITVKF